VRVIFGLGNPGWEYDGSRHNIGFEVVDAAARQSGVTFEAGAGEFVLARAENLLLVKPLTFMNNSGLAVRDVLEQFGIDAAESLTIVDDFDLPLGSVRLRREGSAGTHNGLRSIVWALGSEAFPRLRCGIGGPVKPEDKSRTADFVLSPFEESERENVERMIGRACTAALLFGNESVHDAITFLSLKSK